MIKIIRSLNDSLMRKKKSVFYILYVIGSSIGRSVWRFPPSLVIDSYEIC